MSDEISGGHPAAPATAGATDPQQPPPTGAPVADRLMAMADHCLHKNLLRQAAELYFEMLDRPGAGASEMEHARQCLMEIAEYYQRTGNPHQARSIYEQLL